jgi:hypothetical protein
MKNLVLLSIVSLLTLGLQAQNCSDLIISEYVEGSGNNKAIELYNPTDAPIDLSQYQCGRFRDGSGTPMTIQLTGSIGAYGTYVIALDKRDPNGTGNEAPIDAALEAVADTFVNPVYVQSNSPFYFNGDDAFGLFKGDGTVLVDLFGRIGEDPGDAWGDSNGAWWSRDQTLIRKSSVVTGVTENPLEFDVTAEWDSLPEDVFSELGMHTCDCASVGIEETEASNFNVYPNPAVDKELMISTSKKMKSIQVFNILGQEAERVSFKDHTVKHKLRLEKLRTGIYIVRITMENDSILSKKVMIGK